MIEGIIEEITLASGEESADRSIITVIGVGGAGGNAVNYMWNMGIRNVRFLVSNTDQQALDASPVESVIRLGDNGLGAGNDPDNGRQAALESLDLLRDRLLALNTKMLFITAGMGGGTGTGASPVIAKLAREMGILTVAIVTSPLLVEGKLRYEQAMKGIEALRQNVDSLLIINNENIKNLYLEDLTLDEAFGKANEILAKAAKGISEIVTVSSSLVNVDFADVSRVMKDSGRAHLSVEMASGSDRAMIVAKQSLTSPLLDHENILGAKNILVCIFSSSERPARFSETTAILDYIQQNAQTVSSEGEVTTANIIWGSCRKEDLGDNIEIVLVATGFPEEEENFEEIYGARYPFGDPSSPFERMNVVRNNAHKSKLKTPTPPTEGPLSRGECVTLPERELRYPNIDALLKVPAYIACQAALISDAGGRSHEAGEHSDDGEALLFGGKEE